MKKTTPTVIGVFVIGALALAVAAVLFFGSGLFHDKRLRAVSFFNGSVAGLRVGAPVTFRGVPVGEVKSLGVRVMPDGQSIIQVNMELVPGMVAVYGAEPDRAGCERARAREARSNGTTRHPELRHWASQSGACVPAGRECLAVSATRRAPEIPTVPGDLEALTRQLQTVDIVATVDSLQRTLASLNTILTSPDVKQAVSDLPQVTAALKQTVASVDREVTALSRTGRRCAQRHRGRRAEDARVGRHARGAPRHRDREHARDAARHARERQCDARRNAHACSIRRARPCFRSSARSTTSPRRLRGCATSRSVSIATRACSCAAGDVMRYSLHLVVVIAALALSGCASSPVTLVALPPPPATARAPDEKPGPTIHAALSDGAGLSRRLSDRPRPGRWRTGPVVQHGMGGAPLGRGHACPARCTVTAPWRGARADRS